MYSVKRKHPLFTDGKRGNELQDVPTGFVPMPHPGTLEIGKYAQPEADNLCSQSAGKRLGFKPKVGHSKFDMQPYGPPCGSTILVQI